MKIRSKFFDIQHSEPTGVASIDDGAGDAGGDTGSNDKPPKTNEAKEPEEDDAGPSTVTLGRKAFNDRIDRAKRAGRTELLRMFGVDTDEELADLAERLKGDKPKPEPKQEQKAGSGDVEAIRRQYEAQLKRADKQREAEVEAVRTQARLERMAERAGIADEEIEYAIERLKRHVTGLSEKQADKFDAAAWFADLVEKHPTLKTTQDKPATTGTGGAAEGKAGKAGPPAPKDPKGPTFNAMSATSKEVAQRLAELRRRK